MTPYPLLSLLIAIAPASGPWPEAPPAAPPQASSRVSAVPSWTWPLRPRPAVLHPFDRPAQRWGAGHRGVDLAASTSSVVLAPAAGTVAFVGVIAGRPVVSTDHADGFRSTFEPVVATVSVGAHVGRGDVVGVLSPRAADKGVGHCAPQVCLHWGVRRGESYVDPLALLGLTPPVLLPLHGR